MLLEQKVKITCVPNNKEYFISKGYPWKWREKILIDVHDLLSNSNIHVQVQCDYCFEKNIINVFPKRFADYNIERKIVEKDCCEECRVLKQIDVTLTRYGVRSTTQIPEIKQKQIETLIKNYGVDNPNKSKIIREKTISSNNKKYGIDYYFQTDQFKNNKKQYNIDNYGVEYYSQSDEYKNKIIETSLNKYGTIHYFQTDKFKEDAKETIINKFDVEYISQNEEIKDKIKKTNIERYGVEYATQSKEIQEKIKQTNLEKLGCEYPTQNKDVMCKVKNTLYLNNTAPCSIQQKYVYNLIGGELNYPYYNASLDIAFPDGKLYVECDFSGHWLSIKLSGLTEEEFNKKERNRWYSLYRSGWKEIRIISRKDKIPSDLKIVEMIQFAKNYLNQNHHYIKFDIDNNKIINSQGEFDYNFGKLIKIKKQDLKDVV